MCTTLRPISTEMRPTLVHLGPQSLLKSHVRPLPHARAAGRRRTCDNAEKPSSRVEYEVTFKLSYLPPRLQGSKYKYILYVNIHIIYTYEYIPMNHVCISIASTVQTCRTYLGRFGALVKPSNKEFKWQVATRSPGSSSRLKRPCKYTTILSR